MVGLYHGGFVEANVDTTVAYQQLKSENPSILYSLLAVSGYLKPVERLRADRYRLMIPNWEIKTIYSQEILSHLEAGLGMGSLAELGDAIVQGQVHLFTELLNRYMEASLSYYDTVEAFYHGWVMGLLLILDDDYYCLSNREAGAGRADLMFKPRRGCQGPGLIFEFKYCDKPEQLPKKADEALQQIADKNYMADFLPEVNQVVGYGMSFCGKRCEMRQWKWAR